MRKRQQGSVVTFGIIGVILVGVLVGGIYLLRKQTAQPATVAVSSSDSQNSTSESSKPTSNSEASQDSSQKSTPSSDVQQSTNQESTSLAEENKDSEAVQQSDTQPVELPQTGGSNAMSGALGASLLVGGVLAYVRSRRLVVSL